MKSKLLGVISGLALLVMVSAAMVASPGQNPGFSISAFPPTATVRAGGTANYTAVIDSQGYTGRVVLTCQSNAPGVACSASPSSVKLNPALAASAAITAIAPSTAQGGSYRLTITATSESLGAQKSASVTLLVH